MAGAHPVFFIFECMRKNNIARNLLLLTVLSLGLVSCGSYGKLLKTGDHELIYQGGLRAYQEKRNDMAISLFNYVERYYEGTSRDDTIKFFTASSYFRKGDYYTSDELLQSFRRTFQNRTVFMEEAEYLLAMGYYFLSPDPKLDQTPTIAAISQFYEYLARYPNTTRYADIAVFLTELQQKLYDKSFLNAKMYYDIGYYKSAILTFKLGLAQYPETTRREEILYYITKASFILADNSVEDLQRGRYLEMIDHYYNLISEYPETKYLKETTEMYDKVMIIIKDRYDETIEVPEEIAE